MSHPGRTAAQRRILDEIGCGNYSPMMSDAMRDRLLTNGLIRKCGERHELVTGGKFKVIIEEFEMTIPTHIEWCKEMAKEYKDEN